MSYPIEEILKYKTNADFLVFKIEITLTVSSVPQ